MKTYIVTSRLGIEIHTGQVQLTKAQADKRPGKLAAVKDRPGVYQVVKPTMFKCGERFGYDGEVSKSMLQEIVDEETAKKQAEDAAKAAAAAKAVPSARPAAKK